MADITDLTGLITGTAVYFADPATPTKYDYMCGLNGRGVDQSRERRSDTAVLECGPDAGIETIASSGAYDWQVSGDASMQLKTFDFLNAWMQAGGERNVLVVYYTGAKGARRAYAHIKGTALLTQFNASQGDAEGLLTASVTFAKAGPSAYAKGLPTGATLAPTMTVAPATP